MYCSHNSNIKCVDSTIKYTNFESFQYFINSNNISLFVVFNHFVSMNLYIHNGA